MKKLVLMAAVLFGASMVSCGNGESAAAADTVAAETPEVVEVVEEAAAAVDSITPDSAEVVEAVAEVVE